MEAFLIIFGVAYLVAPIAAFFIALRARNRITVLAQRLDGLENRLAAAPAARTPFAAPLPIELPEAPPPPKPESEPATPAPRTAETRRVEPEPIPSAAPPRAPTAPAEPQPSLEERLGTRWVVWVGGAALALGGIFLVRYSIEQGLIGPGVRTFLGALLAAALIAAGEWTRRNEKLADFQAIPAANIPSILTAAGTITAFATVYAAYALYDFLAPGTAFVLLGAVALASFAAALLHGLALAGLGLVGSYVTPLLVSSDEPDYWVLYVYLAVVTAAAFALARARLWRWLALAAVVLATLWMFSGIDTATLAPHAFHAAAGFVLAAVFIVSGLLFGPEPETGRIDLVSSGALAAFLFGAAVLVLAQQHDGGALATFACLVAATVAIAFRAEAATAAVPVAAILVALVMADWALDMNVEHLIAPGRAAAGLVPEPMKAAYGLHLALGGAFACLFGGAGFLAQGRSRQPIAPIVWAAAAVFAPLAILVALYHRITAFEESIPFAGLALLLAALFAVATEILTKRPPRPGSPTAAALFATGATAALALALAFALEKGWLTVALALMVPGIAWIAERRPIPFLRWLAAAIVVLVLARIGWEPRIVGRDVGTTPIFNWLLYGYGVPAVSFWIAGNLLARRADDQPARTVQSAAILFTVLVAFLEIRHYVNGGDIYRPTAGVMEIGLQASVGLAMTIGLEWVRGRTGSIVHNIGALIVAALTLAVIVLDLVIVVGPRLNDNPVGGLVFNVILLNYGLPALLAIVLALIARATRPMFYRVVAAATAVTLAIFYLSLEVKRFYRGPVFWQADMSDAENYSYSAVWLVFGLLLLVIGFLFKSLPARLAAAAVIMLTVGKVFVIDTSHLTGIWRALSLIGLGLPLVAIGYFYQRYFLPTRQQTSGPPGRAPAT